MHRYALSECKEALPRTSRPISSRCGFPSVAPASGLGQEWGAMMWHFKKSDWITGGPPLFNMKSWTQKKPGRAATSVMIYCLPIQGIIWKLGVHVVMLFFLAEFATLDFQIHCCTVLETSLLKRGLIQKSKPSIPDPWKTTRLCCLCLPTCEDGW